MCSFMAGGEIPAVMSGMGGVLLHWPCSWCRDTHVVQSLNHRRVILTRTLQGQLPEQQRRVFI